jgi:hypothetical protein
MIGFWLQKNKLRSHGWVGLTWRNRARRPPRTRDGWKHQGTPRIHGTAYDVSPSDARCKSLGGAQTKGDDAMRGKKSPRSRFGLQLP